ncbi:unnamed protein product, partial [marine sediment metagenome]
SSRGLNKEHPATFKGLLTNQFILLNPSFEGIFLTKRKFCDILKKNVKKKTFKDKTSVFALQGKQS